jgi:hypothetical protein
MTLAGTTLLFCCCCCCYYCCCCCRYYCHLGLVLIVNKTSSASLTARSAVDSVNNGSPSGLLLATVYLTTYGRLMPRARMRGALYSSHSYDFMASYLVLEEMLSTTLETAGSDRIFDVSDKWHTPLFSLFVSAFIFTYIFLLHIIAHFYCHFFNWKF